MDGLEDIPATGTNDNSKVFLPPYTTSSLVKWAKDDNFYKGPMNRGETVILIQDYRVVGNPQPIHKEIVLFKGAVNKSINIITQSNVTFYQDGSLQSKNGAVMQTRTLRLGTPEFQIVLGKINPNGINADDYKISFGALSRKLTNENDVINNLKPIADLLKAYPDSKVNITGNTSFGTDTDPKTIIQSDNENISVQQLMDGRAQTLSKVLSDKLGVNPKQISLLPGVQGDSKREGAIKVVQPAKKTTPVKKD